jgi:steroid delta-isomerase-like uncharacterized protein
MTNLPGSATAMAESDQLGRLAHDLIAAWNDHDARRVASLFAEDYVGDDVSLAEPLHGPRDVRRLVLYNLLGYPDLHFELHDTLTQGDRIALIWTVRGTHRGRVMNIPPTEAQVEARGITVLTVREGKIWRSLRVWDVAGMLRNIGLLPDLPSLT